MLSLTQLHFQSEQIKLFLKDILQLLGIAEKRHEQNYFVGE